MSFASYCSPSPAQVARRLARPTLRHRALFALVLLTLLVLSAFYSAVVAACCVFLAWTAAAFLDSASARLVLALQLVLSIPVLLFLAFVLRKLCCWHAPTRDDALTISVHEQPRLFDFIGQVCAEVGAPIPQRVLLGGDVNALAAAHGDSFRHFFVPPPRTLHIGLGYVHVLNLTEFKALLAHELGHFTQPGLRLGGYMWMAFGIMHDCVDRRDGLDRGIERWCRMNPLIAWPAWICWAMQWLWRRLLSVARYALYALQVRLMREMELHADLVAVSVCGSDAPVHMLYRGAFAERCRRHVREAPADAGDGAAPDLFAQFDAAAAELRVRADNPDLGEPPPVPVDVAQCAQVFAVRRRPHTSATHPSYAERERNAKRHYVRTDFDIRPAWVLFDDIAALRAEMTRRFT